MKKLWYSLLLLLPAMVTFAQGDPVIHYPLDFNSVYSENLRQWDFLAVKGTLETTTDRNNNPRGAIRLQPGSFIEFQNLQELARLDSMLSDSIFQQHLTFSCWLRYEDPQSESLIFNSERYPGDPTSLIKLLHKPESGYESSYLYDELIDNELKHWDYKFNEYSVDARSQAPAGVWVKLVYTSSNEGTDLYIQVPDSLMPANPYKVNTYSYHSYLAHRPMDQFFYWYLGSSRNSGPLNIDDVKFYDRMLEPEEIEDLLADEMGEFFQADTARNCYDRILMWNDSVKAIHEFMATNLRDSLLDLSDTLFAQNQDTLQYLDNINIAFQLSDSLQSFHDNLLTAWNDSAYAVCDSLFDPAAVPSGDCYEQAQQLDLLMTGMVGSLHNEFLDSAYAYNDSVFATNNDTLAYNQRSSQVTLLGDSVFSFYDSLRIGFIDSALSYCDTLHSSPDTIFESTCYNEILAYADSADLYHNVLRTVYLDSVNIYNDSLYAVHNDSLQYFKQQQTNLLAADSIYNYHNEPLQLWVADAYLSCDSIHLPPTPVVVDTCQESLQHLTDSLYNLIDLATQSFRDSAYGYHDSVLALSGDTNLYHMEKEAAYRASIDLQNSRLNQLYNSADSAYAACGLEFTPRGIIPESDCYDLIMVMSDSLYANADLSRTAFIDSATAYEHSVLLASQDTTTYQVNLAAANLAADAFLQGLHNNIQAAINEATELCHAQFDPTTWGEPGVSCYDEILVYGNSWEEQNKMVSEAFHDSASAFVDSMYTVNNDPEWYQQAKWLAFYSSDSVYQHLDAFRVSWMDSAYTACDSIFNYQPGPEPPSGEDCYALISAYQDSAYTFMNNIRMSFSDSAYAYNDSLYAYNNDYNQYEANLNLIPIQADSVYLFYDSQLMVWNDSAYAYCDSLSNLCTDQIIAWQDSASSFYENSRLNRMDSLQVYHDSLFAVERNYFQYLMELNEAMSSADSIYDYNYEALSVQLDSAFTYCDSLNQNETDPCYGPAEMWADSTHNYHNTILQAYVDSVDSWNSDNFDQRIEPVLTATINMASHYNDSSHNWWSVNIITPWSDSTASHYNTVVSSRIDSSRSWNDSNFTIGDSTHTWNDSVITYQGDSAQLWADQYLLYHTDSIWGIALSGVIQWTDSVIAWGSTVFDSDLDSTYMYHDLQTMAWEDSAWTATHDIVSEYLDSAYAYCDSLYNPPIPMDTSCHGLVMAYSDSVFYFNDNLRIMSLDSAFAYNDSIYMMDNDSAQYQINNDRALAAADSLFILLDDQRIAWTDSAYAYCDSINNPPMPQDTSCYGLVTAFSDSVFYLHDNIRIAYMDSAYAYNDSIYTLNNDYEELTSSNDQALMYADSVFYHYDALRSIWMDSAYAYCDSANYIPAEPDCHYLTSVVSDSMYSYNNGVYTNYLDSAQVYHDSLYAWNNDYEQYLTNNDEALMYADSVFSWNESGRTAWTDSAYAYCDSVNYFNMGPCYGPVQMWSDSTYNHYNMVSQSYTDSAYTWNHDDFYSRSAEAFQAVDSLVSYRDSVESDSLLQNVIIVWMDSTNNHYWPIIQATADSAYSWNNATHTYGDSLYTWHDSIIIHQSDSSYNWLNQLTTTWQDSAWALYYDNFYTWSDSVYNHWSFLYEPYQDSMFVANESLIFSVSDSIWMFGDGLVMDYRDSANTYCDSLTHNPSTIMTQANTLNTANGGSASIGSALTENNPDLPLPVDLVAGEAEEPSRGIRLANFSVFPNPAHHKVHILYESPKAQRISVYMAQTDGKLLHFETVEIPAGRYTYTFPQLSELTSKFSLLQSVVVGLKAKEGNLSEIILIE